MSEPQTIDYEAILQATLNRRLQNADLTDLARISNGAHPTPILNHPEVRIVAAQAFGSQVPTEGSDTLPNKSKTGEEIVEEIFARRIEGYARSPETKL